MDEPNGQGDFEALFDARRRIVAAFEDIAAGTEALALRFGGVPSPAELSRLRAEIDEERMANAQLAERVRSLHEREAGRAGQDGRLAELEASLARAREEIASLEALRAADRAEVDAVLAELIPLVEEAR